jgi:hypothetical protein
LGGGDTHIHKYATQTHTATHTIKHTLTHYKGHRHTTPTPQDTDTLLRYSLTDLSIHIIRRISAIPKRYLQFIY